MKRKNKNLYIFFKIMSYALIVLPVLIYNFLNHEIFNEVNALPLTVAGLITTSTVALSILLKLKNKISIFLILTGVMLMLLSKIAWQLGVSLLLIAGANLLDKLILKKIYLYYKEKYYEDRGRKVVITRQLEE